MIIVVTPVVPVDTGTGPGPVSETGAGKSYSLNINVGQRFALGMIGVDGSVWDLHNGPVMALPGTSGFGSPAPEHWWRTSPSLAGSSWQGSRVPHREVVLPVHIAADSALGWRDVDAAFFSALGDGTQECTWVVATPDAKLRTLPLRFSGGGDVEYERDPMLILGAAYALTFTAGDPYWRGEPVSETFGDEAAQPFFATSGGVVTLSSSRAIATATVTNPGDVDAWPKWTVTGPVTAFTVGVGTTTVNYTGTVAAGQVVVVDTDPRKRTIKRGTTDAWLQVTQADFVAIPPGRDVQLSMSVTGATYATSVAVEFVPRYRKAW